MNLNVCIDKNAKFIINTLNLKGYSAYAVGGCVRDVIMGKTPSDWDITTSACPEKTQEIFASLGIATVPTGIRHGTVSVILENKAYECTSFRIEEGYSDNRHPDTVIFSDRLEDDLCRRDFTVNAMAYSADGRLVDLYGGQADIEKRIIRCVGNPEKRFCEDALRILRAIRFATTLNFEIEACTLAAIIKKSSGLESVSAERKRDELKKILLSCNPNRGLDLIFSCKIEKYMPCTLINPTFEINRLPLCFEARLALVTRDSIEGLKLSKKEEKRVLRFREMPDSVENEVNARRILKKYGEDAVLVCKLYQMHILAALVENEKKSNPCLELSSLAINGHDLSALGVLPQNIGKILNSLLDEVIINPSLNSYESLSVLALNKYAV